jgi:hypothetical protein
MGVFEEWGMQCPECGEDNGLAVEVKVMARLSSDGTEPEGDQDWDDDSMCSCECGHTSKVEDFKRGEQAYRNLIMVAADTVDQLRRCDVYRLMETSESVKGIVPSRFGKWLARERPDCVPELKEYFRDLGLLKEETGA